MQVNILESRRMKPNIDNVLRDKVGEQADGLRPVRESYPLVRTSPSTCDSRRHFGTLSRHTANLDSEFAAKTLLQFTRTAETQQSPTMHDPYALNDFFCLKYIMRNQYDRRFVAGANRSQHVPDLIASNRIQGVGWFI